MPLRHQQSVYKKMLKHGPALQKNLVSNNYVDITEHSISLCSID